MCIPVFAAVVLTSCNLSAGRLHLKASDAPNDGKDELITSRALTCDLNKHVATPEEARPLRPLRRLRFLCQLAKAFGVASCWTSARGLDDPKSLN